MAPFDLHRFLGELREWAVAAAWPVETIRYGALPEQEADLRLPRGHGPHPVAIVLHGGFWRAPYTRAIMAAVATDLAGRGWASWNVEYRRLGAGGGVPETLDDVVAAAAHLRELGAPLDLDRTVAVGHSAGGHLALWLAGTGVLEAAFALGGVCDLAEASRAGTGADAATEFTGGTPEERPAAYDLADPIRRLPTGARQVLVHGTEDDRVPVELSRRYLEAARAAGDRCELVELPGIGHFEPIDPRSPAWARVTTAL